MKYTHHNLDGIEWSQRDRREERYYTHLAVFWIVSFALLAFAYWSGEIAEWIISGLTN